MAIPKFNVGDKAIVIGRPEECLLPEADSPDHTGTIVTIIESLQWMRNGMSGRCAEVYVVDIRGLNGGNVCFEPRHLKPYYDGNEVAEWDKSIFVPKELVKCQSE